MYEIINPLYANGRWYEISIASDGINPELCFSDVDDIVVKDKTITFPETFHVIEVTADYATKPGKAGSLNPNISADKKGNYCVSLASAEIYEAVRIYIFGRYEKR